MFKKFFLKKLIGSKLGNIPEDQKAKIMELVEKRPDLLMKIAGEIKAKTDSGRDQMAATMEVLKVHEAELKELLK